MYNLAKEGAVKDREDEKNEKFEHEIEEDEKYDDKGNKLHSLK